MFNDRYRLSSQDSLIHSQSRRLNLSKSNVGWYLISHCKEKCESQFNQGGKMFIGKTWRDKVRVSLACFSDLSTVASLVARWEMDERRCRFH